MQGEWHGVAGLGNVIANCVADAVVGAAVYRPAWIRPGCDRRNHFRADFCGKIEEGRHGHSFALHRFERIAAEIRSLRPELLPRRRHRREGVGLVLHLDNDEFHCMHSKNALTTEYTDYTEQCKQYADHLQNSFRCCGRRVTKNVLISDSSVSSVHSVVQLSSR